jgi:hypothetical protein
LRIRIDLRLVSVPLLGVLLGCGSTTEPLPACSGAVSVTVTGGTTPTIEWAPACGASLLTVAQPLPPSLGFVGEEARWMIRTDGRLIEPPVRYGRTPRGAVVSVPPQQLEAGRTYRAFVSNGPTVLGSTTFTP